MEPTAVIKHIIENPRVSQELVKRLVNRVGFSAQDTTLFIDDVDGECVYWVLQVNMGHGFHMDDLRSVCKDVLDGNEPIHGDITFSTNDDGEMVVQFLHTAEDWDDRPIEWINHEPEDVTSDTPPHGGMEYELPDG